MRVALVCPYAWDRFGGVQSHVAALARTLQGRGHEVCIFAPSSIAKKDTPVEHHVRLVGRAVGIPANGSVAPLTFGPMAAIGIRTALREFEPEVMHLHEPLIPSLSLLALLNSDVPAVGTFHASADSSLAYRASEPVLRRAMKRLAVRTAVSDAARDLVGRYFPGEYALTPNGIEVDRFADAEPIEIVDRPSVLFFGRLERRKGLEVLIRAMAKLRDVDCELVVAGAGPEERTCRALARSLDVSATFLGMVPEDDKPGLYRGATVYCAPGLGGESFGIVLTEALSAGTPVVCSDLPGYRAVAGEAAELVPPGDPQALADALRTVLLDKEKRSDMRVRSSQTAQLYSWPRLAADVESLLERAASISV